VLEPDQILSVIAKYQTTKTLTEIARIIVEESMKEWNRKYPIPEDSAQIADNATIIIVDLNKLN